MVKKGQKFNKYIPEQRKEILDKYFAGKGSSRSLAKEYNISQNKVLHILADIRSLSRRGSKRLGDHLLSAINAEI